MRVVAGEVGSVGSDATLLGVDCPGVESVSSSDEFFGSATLVPGMEAATYVFLLSRDFLRLAKDLFAGDVVEILASLVGSVSSSSSGNSSICAILGGEGGSLGRLR
jgi:hypothetical protein